jgi:hypothetical protein
MKIIFLDFDGVLNSSRSAAALGGYGSLYRANINGLSKDTLKLDPISVILLRRIVETTGAKIVISSSWRIGTKIEDFHDVFDVYDWNTREIIIDKTKVSGKIRGDEVELWLIDHIHLGIEKFAIIDDESDFKPAQKPFLVQTQSSLGLSHISYNKCLEILGAISEDEVLA